MLFEEIVRVNTKVWQEKCAWSKWIVLKIWAIIDSRNHWKLPTLGTLVLPWFDHLGGA